MNHRPRRLAAVSQVLQDIQFELGRPHGDPPSSLAMAISEARTFQQRFRASPVTGKLRLLKEIAFSLNRAPFAQQLQFNDHLLNLIDSLHLEIERLTMELNSFSAMPDDEAAAVDLEHLPQLANANWPADQVGDISPETSPLRISVIINTANRAAHLRTLLYALERQTYPHFEVIAVVGPSQDDTPAVLQEFADRIHVVECPVYNLSVSRNLGLAAAAGDVVAYLDDDSLPALTWLAQLAHTLQTQNIAGTGGKVYRIHPDGQGDVQFLFGTSSVLGEDYDVRPSSEIPVSIDSPAEWWYPRLTGGNMAYFRDRLLAVGGFDKNFAYMFEEADLAVRLGQQGECLKPLVEALVYHFPADSPNRQKQYLNVNWYAWVKGQVYFALKNGRQVAGWRRTIRHALHSTVTTFREISNYRETAALSDRNHWEIIWQIGKGLIAGFWLGLTKPRTTATAIKPTAQNFSPFLQANSVHTPCFIPPGRLLPAQIPRLVPLRLAVLNPLCEAHIHPDIKHLAERLAEAGHEVHIVKSGPVDRVTHMAGVLIHEIPSVINRYSRYKKLGYAKLLKQLNYSHAVYEKIVSLIINHRLQVIISPRTGLEGLVTAITQIVPTIALEEGSSGRVDNPEKHLQAALIREFEHCCATSLSPSVSTGVLIQTCRSVGQTS